MEYWIILDMTTFFPKSTDNTNVGTLYSSYGFAYKALLSLHGFQSRWLWVLL